jgi:hypothetical protein
MSRSQFLDESVCSGVFLVESINRIPPSPNASACSSLFNCANWIGLPNETKLVVLASLSYVYDTSIFKWREELKMRPTEKPTNVLCLHVQSVRSIGSGKHVRIVFDPGTTFNKAAGCNRYLHSNMMFVVNDRIVSMFIGDAFFAV